MTVGNPTKHLIQFSLPLLVGNLFQQLYNMVDSLIVGNFVGPDALASVGTCGSVNFLFFSLGNGLAIGIGIIVAQYFGAHNDKNIKAAIGNAVYVLASVSLIASLIGYILSPFLLHLLSTPDKIINDAIIYMRTTCCGMLFIALYNGVAAILRALGDSKTPLYFLILSSIVNVVLDLVFVLYLNWGVFGVAFATIISQAVSAITSILYSLKKIPYFKIDRQMLQPNSLIIRRSFQLGLPIALQNSMIAVSCIALQGVINSFGETIMATATIISRIEQIIQQPYMSLSAALTTYSGQNIGANQIDRVKKGFRQACLMVFIFNLCLIPIFFLFGGNIISIFVKDAEVIAIGRTALKINSVCYFGLGMIYMPRAVLNGCGDTGFAMINGVTEVACRVIFSQVFTRIPFLGFWGIWVTTGATWTLTAVVCLLRYAAGVWKHKKIVSEKSI